MGTGAHFRHGGAAGFLRRRVEDLILSFSKDEVLPHP